MQKNETPEDFEKRKNLMAQADKVASEIASLYQEKSEIQNKLRQLRNQYDETWDLEKIRQDVAKEIMRESIARRAERKRQKEMQKEQACLAWMKAKAENIVFIGKGYSGRLSDKETDEAKLVSLGLPVVNDDKELAALLGIEYKQLRFLAYHRDVVATDNYNRYSIPKKSGGERQIAAPKPVLKFAQKMVLEQILEKIPATEAAHGFIKGKSVLTNASAHKPQPKLLINMDLENFFPTITFPRVLGVFNSLGYSGYISSILAMLCTYCERMPIEVKNQVRYVKTSERILPQGSPASPMITNIICKRLDGKMAALAGKHGFAYSRYADDMSLSFEQRREPGEIKRIAYEVAKAVYSEGFKINKKKTRYLGGNSRQSVTGILINNEQLGVPKEWVKKLRAAIHNANMQKSIGLEPANAEEITGMAAWLHSVNPERYNKIIMEAKQACQNT